MERCHWLTWWCWHTVNNDRRLLFQLCCKNALCIMKPSHFPTKIFAQAHRAQRFISSMANPCFLHSYSWICSSQCCTFVSKLVRNCRIFTAWQPATSILKKQQDLHKHAGLWILLNHVECSRGQSCKKDFWRQCIVLVSRAPWMYNGRRGGIAAVQSSCSFSCRLRIRTERLVAANNRKK